MARIESGKLELDLAPVDTSRSGQRRRQDDRAAGQRSRTCSSALNTPALAPVLADKRAIKQVLLNLMSNAIKFTQTGGFVTVETRAENGGVTIWVHDTGIGIAEGDIARVIKPFERVETSATGRRRSGVGLGLAGLDARWSKCTAANSCSTAKFGDRHQRVLHPALRHRALTAARRPYIYQSYSCAGMTLRKRSSSARLAAQ